MPVAIGALPLLGDRLGDFAAGNCDNLHARHGAGPSRRRGISTIRTAVGGVRMARSPMSCFVASHCAAPDGTTYGGDQVKRREVISFLVVQRMVAPRGERAAADDAGDRFPQWHFGAGPRRHTAAFRQGLSETGYVDARNVTIEYRCADNRTERAAAARGRPGRSQGRRNRGSRGQQLGLCREAADRNDSDRLHQRRDPVKAGLVASLNRPAANVTGVSWFAAELGNKRSRC